MDWADVLLKTLGETLLLAAVLLSGIWAYDTRRANRDLKKSNDRLAEKNERLNARREYCEAELASMQRKVEATDAGDCYYPMPYLYACSAHSGAELTGKKRKRIPKNFNDLPIRATFLVGTRRGVRSAAVKVSSYQYVLLGRLGITYTTQDMLVQVREGEELIVDCASMQVASMEWPELTEIPEAQLQQEPYEPRTASSGTLGRQNKNASQSK